MSDISKDEGLGPGLRNTPVNSHSLLATPEGRSSEFVAVSGADSENTSASAMLVTAYSLFWLILLGFVWLTWRRQQSLADRLKNLESRISNLQRGDGP